MSGSNIGLEVDGSDVVELGSPWFSVDRTLVQFTVFTYTTGFTEPRVIEHTG